MKIVKLAVMLALVVTPAAATQQVSVPEMDVGAGFAAIALLAGIGAIIREKVKR